MRSIVYQVTVPGSGLRPLDIASALPYAYPLKVRECAWECANEYASKYRPVLRSMQLCRTRMVSSMSLEAAPSRAERRDMAA